VFWSASPQLGWPLVVLDYDLVELDEANEEWFAGVFARAHELRIEWNAVASDTVLWAAEPLYSSLGDVIKSYVRRDWGHLLNQGLLPPIDLRRTQDARLSRDTGIRIPKLVEFEPRLDERSERIRSDVNGGRHVKMARGAYVRQRTFRSVTSNTLLAQLLSYRPGQRDAAQELVSAFVDGLRITQFASTNAPIETRAAAPNGGINDIEPPAAEPPRPRRVPGIGLTPGEHLINGEKVVVEAVGNGSGDTVHYPLPPGGYIVDGKRVNVTNPASEVTFMVNVAR
jgi:hypothetical protein